MKRTVSKILVVLLIISVISSIGAYSPSKVEAENTRVDFSSNVAIENSEINTALPQIIVGKLPSDGSSPPENTEKAGIIEHKITQSELEELRSKVGVYTEGQNYNQQINGYGTGLRPPTEDEWTRIADSTYVVDRVTYQSSPISVDQSAKPWFPPIGHQDGEGSCTAWAVGYYVKTFQEAREHTWNLSGAAWEGGYSGHPTLSYQNRITSPDFVYHLINGGVDSGSSFYGAIQLICFVGACSWEKMSYDPVDHTTWPSEEAWTEAPLSRGNDTGYEYMFVDTDLGLTNLKNFIASEHLAVIGVDANKYPALTSSDLWTLDNYVNPSVNHANTIVGYDDKIAYIENGQQRYGAFKIANSWGVGSWEKVNDGFYWISYEAMKQRIEYCMFYQDVTGYKPELAATFRISHNIRDECDITVGLGNRSAPIVTKSFSQYIFGGSVPFCSNSILFDITEFKKYVSTEYNQSYFLKVYDGGSSTIGTISKFAVEYANSAGTPMQTINGDYVFLNVTLSPLSSNWTKERLVNSDQDSLDHKVTMATDSNGSMYVAFADRSLFNKTDIFVRKSSDGGATWNPLIGVWDYHDLGHPSIAIDPYSNEIYVAFEREWALNDHDIFVLRSVNETWEIIPVANIAGQDDRFPSITCEYQFGSSNWQYISYEYVYSNDDRDLMFAKSTDNGATWSVKKLHGSWPDGNVHAQTSITNAEGTIYIAYKWGADYGSLCEIRVDRSTDFGDTWTQFSDVDGLPNDCQYPSIAATHGGDVVVVGFQYRFSASDFDIWYSYSINKGSTWIKSQALFISGIEDEKSIALAVDGEGTQNPDVRGYIHAVCSVGRYAQYRVANYSQPNSWSTSKIIGEGWIGKGLAITVRPTGNAYCPYVAWSDFRTKNIFSAGQLVMPKTWTVDDDGPADFSSIQPAINVANAGDTVYVRTGIYFENVVVNKTISLIGENQVTTIIDGGGTGDVVTVEAGYCLITNFTIRNSGTTFPNWPDQVDCGVYLKNTTNSFINNNMLVNNYVGIYFYPSSNNTAFGNIVSNNDVGISVWSSNNTLMNNTVAGNFNGISIMYCSANKLLGNIVKDNIYSGIDLYYTESNFLENNVMNDNRYSFGVSGFLLSTFVHDIGTSNTANGKPIYYLINSQNQEVPPDAGFVALVNCTNIIVRNLNLQKNLNGLIIAYTNNSLISGNNVTNNRWGLSVQFSFFNTIYHNNFINEDEAFVYEQPNNWDDGYPSGGNYWSDYSGVDLYSGFYQNVTGSDGIGDTPYIIYSSNQDRYPLMNQNGWKDTKLDFSLKPNPMLVGQTVVLLGNLSDRLGQPLNFTKVDIYLNGAYTASLFTNSSGWFKASAPVTSPGTYVVNVTYAGSDDYNPSSDAETLTVLTKLDTKVTFTLSPNPITVGQSVTLKGNLTDIGNNPIGNAPLELWVKIGAGPWRYVTALSTNGTGWFQASGLVSSAGTYQVAVVYRGTSQYNLSYHIETLTVNP